MVREVVSECPVCPCYAQHALAGDMKQLSPETQVPEFTVCREVQVPMEKHRRHRRNREAPPTHHNVSCLEMEEERLFHPGERSQVDSEGESLQNQKQLSIGYAGRKGMSQGVWNAGWQAGLQVQKAVCQSSSLISNCSGEGWSGRQVNGWWSVCHCLRNLSGNCSGEHACLSREV